MGFLVCSLKMRVPFIHRIMLYQLISFRNAWQLYLLSFCVFQVFFRNSLITSGNQTVRFLSFVYSVFWVFTSYTAISVFWRILMERPNALALWWICACLTCVSGVRSVERNLNFLRCIHVFDLVLKNGSDINDWNCWQLLFYFIVLIFIVASVIELR